MPKDREIRGRTSPNRTGLSPLLSGVDPELSKSRRTRELATDQSIAARHLLYYPNENCLAVIDKCVKGIDCIMNRLKHTGDPAQDLLNDEILISMSTRLMADGGIGRLISFNETLEDLVRMKSEIPIPPDYTKKVRLLADRCRSQMAEIQEGAVVKGPDGAYSRQALLALMGDLGGLEPHESGFGQAYKGPLCDAALLYATYTAGLCDAYRRLDGIEEPATAQELAEFRVKFKEAKANTSDKGGTLSAPKHTKNKKGERAPLDWEVIERKGLLDTGEDAELQLMLQYPGHHTTLLNPAWPSYQMPREIIEDVVEPVTGHISGTFGEMATTMNMFCGTPLETMTLKNPSGTPREASVSLAQIESIAALVAAALITAGYHSAVEIYQVLSTLTTQVTLGGIGPKAVDDMTNHAHALRDYAAQLKAMPNEERPKSLELHGYQLTTEELQSDWQVLEAKAKSLEDAASKAVDMISMLQGGGTLATLDVNRVMARASSYPDALFDLYSQQTQSEELSINGQRPDVKEEPKPINSRWSSFSAMRRTSVMDPFDEEEEELVEIEQGVQKKSNFIPFELISEDPSSMKKVLKVLVELQKKHSPEFVVELAQRCLSYAKDNYPKMNTKPLKSFIERANVPVVSEKGRSSSSFFKNILRVFSQAPADTNEAQPEDQEKRPLSKGTK